MFLNKKIRVSKHALERFNEREVLFDYTGRREKKELEKLRRNRKMSKESYDARFEVMVYRQIKRDLKAMEIRKIEKSSKGENEKKITTNHGKTYVIVVLKSITLIKTVYKTQREF